MPEVWHDGVQMPRYWASTHPSPDEPIRLQLNVALLRADGWREVFSEQSDSVRKGLRSPTTTFAVPTQLWLQFGDAPVRDISSRQVHEPYSL